MRHRKSCLVGCLKKSSELGFIIGEYNKLLSFKFFLESTLLCSSSLKPILTFQTFSLRWNCYKHGCWRWSNHSQRPWRNQPHYHHRDANQCIVDLIHDKICFLIFVDWLGMCFHCAGFWELTKILGLLWSEEYHQNLFDVSWASNYMLPDLLCRINCLC